MRNITVAITVDDKMGIAFNNRRQSKDKILIADICNETESPIYVTSYSAPLFEEYEDKIRVVKEPMRECPDDGVCFVEMTEIRSYANEISRLVIYRWNRHYPSDKKLDFNPSDYGFIISDT